MRLGLRVRDLFAEPYGRPLRYQAVHQLVGVCGPVPGSGSPRICCATRGPPTCCAMGSASASNTSDQALDGDQLPSFNHSLLFARSPSTRSRALGVSCSRDRDTFTFDVVPSRHFGGGGGAARGSEWLFRKVRL